MRRFLATLITLSSLSLAWGQNGPAPAYGLEGSTSDDQVVLPAILSGDSVSALFPAEGERSNYLNGGFTFATAYDDNMLGNLKTAMSGAYHAIDFKKYAHRYLAEFDFRYSNRVKLGVDDVARTERALKGIVGKRLTYRTPAH